MERKQKQNQKFPSLFYEVSYKFDTKPNQDIWRKEFQTNFMNLYVKSSTKLEQTKSNNTFIISYGHIGFKPGISGCFSTRKSMMYLISHLQLKFSIPNCDKNLTTFQQT